MVHEFEPLVRLCADSLEPGACFRFWVSLSLWPSPTHALSLSVSKINIKKKFSIRMKYLYTPPEWVKVRLAILSIDEDVEQLEFFRVTDGITKWELLWKRV